VIVAVFLMPTVLVDTNLSCGLTSRIRRPRRPRWCWKTFFISIHSHRGLCDGQPITEGEESAKEGDSSRLTCSWSSCGRLQPGGRRVRYNELNFFSGKNFLVTYHERPIRSVTAVEGAAEGDHPYREGPNRVAHQLLDSIVENYSGADELSIEIGELGDEALQNPRRRR